MLFGIFSASFVFAAQAGEVNVVDATATAQSDGKWTVSVTLKHADSGWEHYADAWQIFDDAGILLGERILLHPHVTEQPFTRSLSGVTIPSDLNEIQIRARDNVHGRSSQIYVLRLIR